MHQLMKDQNDGVLGIAQAFLKGIDLDVEAGLVISAAHKEAADAYTNWLSAEYKRLNEELERTVLELSAKIQVTGELIRLAAREIGKQEALEIWGEEGET